MKTYRCHKIVQAAKIQSLYQSRTGLGGEALNHRALLDDGSSVDFNGAQFANARVGGYYVVYEDGYASYSPAAAFEAGYAEVQPAQPGQYRKKPVVIDATQWFKNGDHPQDYSKTHDGLENGVMRQFSPEYRRERGWEGDVVRYFRRPDVAGAEVCKHCGNQMHDHGWIDTLEGGHIVCPGDWIIRGVKGELYPCKPDIFAATYEPA